MTLRPNDYDRNGDIIPDSVREDKGDLISRSALIKWVDDSVSQYGNQYSTDMLNMFGLFREIIDSAPTVETPKGEYEFIEILAQYVPDDICTYPEYKGKPYYSIHYKQNEEEFVGFGTYIPEVLSRYLKEYFMKGGAK